MLNVFSDVGELPDAYQGEVKSAPLQERPYPPVEVCDKAPVLAHSCAGRPGGASGVTLPSLGCYFTGDVSSKFEALPSP